MVLPDYRCCCLVIGNDGCIAVLGEVEQSWMQSSAEWGGLCDPAVLLSYAWQYKLSQLLQMVEGEPALFVIGLVRLALG